MQNLSNVFLCTAGALFISWLYLTLPDEHKPTRLVLAVLLALQVAMTVVSIVLLCAGAT
jgi:hypothetical protein